MKHPQTFLLEKMIGYEKNGLSSLGTLNAKHIDDIVQVMVEFGEAMAIEVAERISKGEEVKLLTGTISLQKVSKKKTKQCQLPQ
jgi:16S rRNA C1402 N4-methylase RsmH